MRIIYGFLFLCGCLVLLINGAFAVTPPHDIIPTRKVEKLASLPVPDLKEGEGDTPVTMSRLQSQWKVDEFTRDNGLPTGECIMKADYDNGMEVTFKGKRGQLSALRVKDLMQTNQQTRVDGFISLELGDNTYGLQSKSMQGQIDASLLTVPAPAEKIIDMESYKLKIGNQDYMFSADEFGESYRKLLKCQGYENAKTMTVVNEPFIVPSIPQDVINVPSLSPVPIDDMSSMYGDKDQMKDFETVDDALSVRMQTWSARKGDHLDAVLEDWAIKAGVLPKIDLKDDIVLEDDVKIFGPFDIAVEQLLGRYNQASLNATLKSSKGVSTNLLSSYQSQKTNSTSVKGETTGSSVGVSKSTGRIENWRALQGTDLRKVLKRWSVKEGIGFVWNADQRFLLKKTTKQFSNYDEAVSALLSQYENQDVKPVGTLNVDPQTGKKTLIINVSNAT